MNWKPFIYNSITMSLPKNIVQFLVGFILFTMLFGYDGFVLMLLGLAGFVLSYASVYLLNDIKDVEEDRKDPMKLKWKMIANGTLSVNKAVYLCVIFLVSGLFISFLVNGWFLLMMISLIVLNVIYSTFKLKRWMPAATIFLLMMQFLKFSSGWFAMTTSFSLFPFWLVMTLALAYTAIFVGYKQRFKREFMKKHKYLFVLLAVCLLSSFSFSLLFHNFPLSMLMLFVLCILWIASTKKMKIKSYSHKTMLLFYMSILPMIMASFLILAIPATAEMNDGLNDNIQDYKSKIVDVLPDWFIEPIRFIKNSVVQYNDLNDIINLEFPV